MVVLVILAIVSTVALQALQPQVESQRFDSASKLLGEIKLASLGPNQKFQTDGTPLISGFVADVGRLPAPFAPTNQEELNSRESDSTLNESPNVLSELWSPNSQLATQFPYQFRSGPTQPIDYSSIRIPCGWRGPYLQLAIGANSVKDPWGRAPTLTTGVDGKLESVVIELPAGTSDAAPESLAVDLTSGKVQVTGKVLLNNPENATVRVALLSPSPERSLTTLAVLDDEDPMPDSFLFQDVPVGLRAIVCEANGTRQVKYVQVLHTGVTAVFDFLERDSNEAASQPATTGE